MNQMGTPQMGHMNRGGMPPPNGTQPGMPNSAHQTPQPPFRSPSRPSTPGQNSITHASPSMAARQTPNLAQHELINNEFRQVPMQALPQLKQEIGLGDKDLQAFTVQDKHNIIQAWRRRVQKPPQGQPNAVAGPSGTPMMAPGNPRLQPNQQQGQPQGMAPGQQRPIKRNSTSPAEEQDSLLRTDSSPPDRKRPRRSPNPEHQQQQQGQQQQQSQQPAMAPFPHAHPQGGGPGGPGGPQHMPNVLMRPPQMGGPPMGNFPGQPGMPNMINNPGMNMGMGQMGPGGMNAMSPGMMNHPQGGMVNPGPHSQQQYRQTMHNLHKSNLPPGALNMMPGQNMNSPHSNDPLFNNADGGQGQRQPFPGGVPNNRMQGPKAGQMPPPPSPAMNGIGKGPQGGPKPEGVSEQGAQNGRPEGSPQNASAGIGQGQNQQQGNPGQPSTAPPTPASNGMTAPSPSQILSSSAPGMNPSSGNSTDSMPSNLFTTDFMSSMGSMNGGAFDDIDPAIFGGLRDTDINFERDFGQWFNPDDVALDMTK
ncbi:hypothetical protein GLOTRDRAFT_115545 [Gloeophyllum trabeum ATCC 11539]|uniref:Uncharacterized protein n=1 Tax=Gloeophyllum trabeum (strain ATCC 11539 / FP-39264 / Madison 617) TaxID=670483 RepID=S7QA09_GLOTA|nr:uncharacterized protein GLOTRDRAFT_115545 [Gloeophyllum trabeum ATCC 11539]EPQ56188.1 hypothetical protein GLOTRDRAFT_115545 [Gloeophyllum trabeum ATCC 11539]